MSDVPSAAAIVLAVAPESAPDDGTGVAFLPLAGRRLVSWCVASVSVAPGVGRVLVVVRAGDRELAATVLAREVPDVTVELVTASGPRSVCEYAAVRRLAGDIRSGAVELVLIHDTAQPLAGQLLLREVLSHAQQFHAAVPGLASGDYLEPGPEGQLVRAYATERFVRVQSPSAFDARRLLDAFKQGEADGVVAPGDAATYMQRFAGIWPRTVPGDPRNITIVHPHDVFTAERLLADLNYSLS